MTAQEALQAVVPRGTAVADAAQWQEIAEALDGLSRVVYTWKDGCLSTEMRFGPGDRQSQRSPGSIELDRDPQTGYPYARYLPPGFTPGKKWPLVFFFHGIGERGDDPGLLLRRGLPRYLLEGGRLDAVMIAPQCPSGSHWVDAEEEHERLRRFLEEMAGQPFVDPDRIYITGLSMGGRCAWKTALTMPDTFAAMAVVCGRTEQEDLSSLRDLPIWMFHGVKDEITPFRNIGSILERLTSQDHRYWKLTVYPAGGHDVWTEAYAYRELYDWLLAQVRPGAAPEGR